MKIAIKVKLAAIPQPLAKRAFLHIFHQAIAQITATTVGKIGPPSTPRYPGAGNTEC